MTTAQQIAKEAVLAMCGKVQMTVGTREEFIQRIALSFEPHIVTQTELKFDPDNLADHGEQRKRILAILKDRRSVGVTNVELSKIALRFGGRLHELRREPFCYRILTANEGKGLFRYRLSPECY